MAEFHEGGCLCGDIRYKTTAAPQRVTTCHCAFCQRFTGSAFLVEPVFRREDVAFAGATPRAYDHRSEGGHRRVTLNFCGRCATTLYLSFRRFPDLIGLCGGTFDDPDRFERSSALYRHIFTRSAQSAAFPPAELNIYQEHALQLDGTADSPIVLIGLGQDGMVTREG